MAELHRLRWRRPPGGLVALVVTVVALLGIGLGLWATWASAATGYRTGAVTTATVRKTLAVSGTAAAVHQATADFQVAGTVSALDVSLDQHVTAGQTLASLATTTLEKDVASAQASLTSAEAELTEDESAQSSSTSTSTSTSSSSSTATTPSSTTTTAPVTTTTTATGSPAGAGSSSSALAQAQQAVVAAQQAADSDSATADAALGQAQTACSSSSTTTTSTTTTSTTTTTTPSTTTPSGTTTKTSGGSTSAACSSALAQALAAQKQVQTDQKAVAQAETALAKLLSSSSSGTASSGTTGSSSTGSGSTGSSSTGSGTTGSASSTASSGSSLGTTTASDSAAQLASDQASIDTAKASLIEAQQNLAYAQLSSPISGTVVSVGLSVGQSVSAGSSTDAVTIINSGSFETTSTLTPTQASTVKVGDEAQVTVTGTDGTLTGTVSRVGPVDTSSSGYTYPLVVSLPAGSHGIAAGSSAQVTVVLAEAKHAQVVPTSAVHTAGGTSYLDVLRTGQEARDPVQVGVVGAEYTQITSKLPAKAEVILADLSEAVPSSSSDSSSTDSLLGGTSGGGLPAGGASFVGGGFPRG